MKFSKIYWSCLLSGLLLVAAWPDFLFAGLAFFAWVPILLVLVQASPTQRIFWPLFVAMLTWNAGTTWWIWNSTAAGAIGAIVANSLLMCIPLLLARKTVLVLGKSAGLLCFVLFWLGFEYTHLNWQLSWPWLTLGNVFAEQSLWVQWYEYTGVGGGSLWVLLVNVCLTQSLVAQQKTKWRLLGVALLLLPLFASILIYNYEKPGAQGNHSIVVVQPNVDPYSEKFDAASAPRQVEKLIQLSEAQMDTSTRLVLWPETALSVAVVQDEVAHAEVYQPVFRFAARHPQITIQTGIETFKLYGREKATSSARRTDDGTYYDAFNASVSIQDGRPLQFYNKSKLVPGVETLPDFLLWMSAVFEKFGGTTGGYGHDKESVVFKQQLNPYATAPIICYESIYGEYIAGYVKKGANVITIMTNDGWWANTAGHRQHLQYARLRAIETRRWVARSANTGISAVIDEKGSILASRPWNTTSAIRMNIPALTEKTFYVQHGDFIFRIGLWLALLCLAFLIFNHFKSKTAK